MEPVPRTLPENFRVVYEWLRRLDRRTQRVSRPPALMPGARLGPSVGQVEDLNDAVLTGWYQSPSPSNLNRPPANGSLEIQVVALESGSVFQTARTHGTAGLPYGEEWVRDLRGAQGWSDWRPMRLPVREMPVTSNTFRQGVDLGNGSGTLSEWVTDGVLHQKIDFSLGSTSSVTADIQVYVGWGNPTSPTVAGTPLICGQGRVSKGSNHFELQVLAQNNLAYLRAVDTSGNWARVVSVSSSIPNAWSSNHRVQAMWSIPLS